ncbi:MAG: hypothetical protein MJZ37_00335 [Bacilli bacterium]|nr:hypothetical protein [Bacilli bacterium]
MSEKEYKEKCNNMFAKNSILLHRIDELKEQIEQLSNDNHVLKTSFIMQQEQIEVLEEKLQKAKNMLPTWQKEKL